ncbi:MAG: PorT family protein [Vicingaceae bacterium]|nr:PorT family protein [Vicingaceae bacterium]
MKTPKLITLILFSVIFLNLSAQEDDDRSFRFGLHFSPNISWLNASSDGYEKNGPRIGFAYGLSAEFFLAKNYLFSTGFSLTSLGGNLSYSGVYNEPNTFIFSPTRVNQSYNLKYVEIPLSLKLRTNEIGYMTYYGNFGFKTGVNYSAKGDFDYKSKNVSRNDESIKSDISFFNMWLIVGIGAEYSISGNTAIMFGLTFNNGFINTLDNKVHQLDAMGMLC